MRQYDVFSNPIAAVRAERPFVLILQHDRLDWTRSVIIAPLSPDTATTNAKFAPTLSAAGRPFALLLLDIVAVNRRRLRGPPIDNLESQHVLIQNALDHVFSAAG